MQTCDELPDEETCWLSGYQVKHPTVCMYSRRVPLIPAGQFGCLKKKKKSLSLYNEKEKERVFLNRFHMHLTVLEKSFTHYKCFL